MPDETSFSISDACAVLDLDAGQINRLAAEPFTPRDGRMTVRQMLGLKVMTAFPDLEAATAHGIAVACANGAREDGTRLLAIGWATGAPAPAWVEAIPSELSKAVIVIPAERMLTDLSAAVAAHRAAMERLN